MKEFKYINFPFPTGTLQMFFEDAILIKINILSNSPKSFEPQSHWQKLKVYNHPISEQLDKYFSGEPVSFDINLKMKGTPFQKKVWAILQNIPFGQTVTYGEIAQKLRNSKAARAVGMACNKNPIPIIIPCHRVVGKSGNLAGYAGGLKMKKYLLDLEKGVA